MIYTNPFTANLHGFKQCVFNKLFTVYRTDLAQLKNKKNNVSAVLYQTPLLVILTHCLLKCCTLANKW